MERHFPKSLIVEALKQATPAQLLKISLLIGSKDLSANHDESGQLRVFYAEEVLEDFHRRLFDSEKVMRGIKMVGVWKVADILLNKDLV